MTAPSTIRPLIAGNWKMNGSKADLAEAERVNDSHGLSGGVDHADVLICPPASLVMVMAEALKAGPVRVGAQDCHSETKGAFTGDVSAELFADAGASSIIVGHSERRTSHKESDAIVNTKAKAAWRAGLTAIICVGETEAERKAGDAFEIVSSQLAGSVPDSALANNTVIAYEPVWAIGTGVTPTNDEIREIHAFIRERLVARFGAAASEIRLLYGGSVKPSNAREILAIANVNGALVGGASLKAADFLGIIGAVGS